MYSDKAEDIVAGLQPPNGQTPSLRKNYGEEGRVASRQQRCDASAKAIYSSLTLLVAAAVEVRTKLP